MSGIEGPPMRASNIFPWLAVICLVTETVDTDGRLFYAEGYRFLFLIGMSSLKSILQEHIVGRAVTRRGWLAEYSLQTTNVGFPYHNILMAKLSHVQAQRKFSHLKHLTPLSVFNLHITK